MGIVVITLLPAMIADCVFFGWGFLIQFVLASTAGLMFETLALKLRGQPAQPALSDVSTLITAALLSFCMPPLAPWWLVMSAMAFAVLLAKHLYGGPGTHLFNPAMVGYAVLLISFPAQMTQWLPATSDSESQVGFLPALHAILTGHLPVTLDVNVLSSASPLAALNSGLALRHTMDEILATPTFGSIAGAGWEWVALCTLLGGTVLLSLRIIRWHIPIAMLGTIIVISSVMNLLDPGRYATVTFHLFSGASIIGAFYIATDPVTAPSSAQGRIIYGGCIGLLTYIIRSFGYYHDGVAFAVLTMNMLSPVVDKLTAPTIHDAA